MLSHTPSDSSRLSDLRRNHVVCRLCKVKGVAEDGASCPECGAAMRKPNATYQDQFRTVVITGVPPERAPQAPSPRRIRCVYCERDDVIENMRGEGIRRHCADEVACAARVRERNAPVRPLLAAAPSPIRKPGTSPAEAMLDFMRTRADVANLSGPIIFGDDLSLPIGAVQARKVMFGKSGCGKTHKSAVIAENCLANNVPVAILDKLGNLWGLRAPGAGGSGYPVPIIGGAHGDLPLSAEDGAILAAIFAEGTSMLIDLSLLSLDEAQKFEAEFFSRLMLVLRIPSHVIVEEAETTCPALARSKAQFAAQGAALLFARQIRNFGVGWTFSTQRMQLLHPDAIGSSSVFLAMQSTGDKTQTAIRKEARSRVGDVIADAIFAELGILDQGETWLIPDPNWLGERHSAPIRYRVRQRYTYDSSAPPKIGEAIKEPPRLIQVSLKAFKQLKRAA